MLRWLFIATSCDIVDLQKQLTSKRVETNMNDSTQSSAPLLYCWFDLEFTDLDPAKAHILQVAMLITDVHLQPVLPDDAGLNLIVRLDDQAIVSGWVQENLADLLGQCRQDDAISPDSVQALLLAYLSKAGGTGIEEIKERPVLAGNSVHADWRLACMHYPDLITQLTYRLLDVSTLKQQWTGWWQQPEFDKEDAGLVERNLPFPATHLAGKPHDAYYDILASIAELHYYRRQLRLAIDS